MTNEEKILEMLAAMQNDINAIKQDVSVLKQDVEELRETAEITRTGVNALIDWAEDCGNAIKFPLPRIAK